METITYLLPPNAKRQQPLEITPMRLLGSGTFGKVYEVNVNNQPYALKVVDKSRLYNPTDARAVQNEVNILNLLSERVPGCTNHLLCYYDISQDRNNIYLLSELLDTNYYDIIVNGKYCDLPLSIKGDLVYNIILQLLNGLKTLHNVGIIHRDIKAENVLIKQGNPSTAKLGDFGFSCNLRDNECRGDVGSLEYAAPSILLGNQEPVWTVKEDLYALACLTYFALTCQYYVGENELNELRDVIMYSRSRNMDDMIPGLKWYDNIYDKKIISEKNIQSLRSMIRQRETIDKKRYEKLEKLYRFCEKALNPQDRNIYTVDDITRILL